MKANNHHAQEICYGQDILVVSRVALSAGTGEPGSLIAKDLIDSEDPKHTLFCHKTAFVAI